MKKQKIIFSILLLLITVTVILLISLVSKKAPFKEKSISGSGWLVYENTEAGFRVNYPPNWKLGQVDESREDYKRISLNGKEGEILFDWGKGFGGYCEKWEEIDIKNDKITVCNGTDQEGRKTISIAAKDLGTMMVGGAAFVNKPILENEKVVYKILSTLEFYKNPGQTSVLESKSRSSAYIYIPDVLSSTHVEVKTLPSGEVISRPPLEKVKVYLYAPNEMVTKVENIYCGAPVIGASLYRGHYQLILDASTLTMEDSGFQPHIKPRDSKIDIGEYEFVGGTYHDGQIITDQLDPNDYRNFIIIYSYGSCNSETIRVYGYDLLKDSLVLYKFRDRNGKVEDSACISTTADFPVKPLIKSKDGNLVTRCYSQITGKNEVSEWKFILGKGEFQEIKYNQESF